MRRAAEWLGLGCWTAKAPDADVVLRGLCRQRGRDVQLDAPSPALSPGDDEQPHIANVEVIAQ